jgi:hypothetical protein
VSEVALTGLRAENPMAFLAALGALSLASDGSDGSVALSWRVGPDGSWSPVLHSSQLNTPEYVVEAIVAAHRARDPKRELGWDKDLMRVSRDALRKLLEERLDEQAGNGNVHAAWMIAACLCELPLRTLQQPAGAAVSYTPFRLIPRVGRARFLDAALRECEAGVDHLHVCLFEPWRYQRGTQSLRWDPGAAVSARALMAQAPTHLGPSGVPGAVLLAVRGLAFFPLVTSRGGRIGRAAPPGMAQRRDFVWPVWGEPLDERTTRMMLSMPWPRALIEAREVEDRTSRTKNGRQIAREARDKLSHARNQLRAHGVIACYVAPRVRRGDDDEALGWGRPILV